MMRQTDDFYFFWKHEFGQWTMRDMTDSDRITYNCCEQYMMYKKAMLFDDVITANKILSEDKPRNQQSLGRDVSNFDQKIWDAHKFDIVKQANLLKFTQHPRLKVRLLATGNKILVEASPYDLVWGVGFAAKDDKILDMANWRGQNLLGKVLMSVRTALTGNTV